MSVRGRRVMAWLERNPTAVDCVIAMVFSVAALVSLYATVELLRQDPAFHDPSKPAIVVSLLAVTLPLALRRRYPLTVAVVVIGAFVAGRLSPTPPRPGLPRVGVAAGW